MRTMLRWLPVAAWAGVIYALSSVPGSNVPGRFGPLGHFVLYLVLAALIAAAMRDPELPRRLVLAVLLASAYGVTDEFHQSFVPGRYPDPADWLIDTAGAIVGAALIAFIVIRRASRT